MHVCRCELRGWLKEKVNANIYSYIMSQDALKKSLNFFPSFLSSLCNTSQYFALQHQRRPQFLLYENKLKIKIEKIND